MVQATKKKEILPAGQPRIEAEVTARVIPDLPAHSRGFARGIVAGQGSGAPRRQKERGKNTKQGRFAGSVGASPCFTSREMPRNAGDVGGAKG